MQAETQTQTTTINPDKLAETLDGLMKSLISVMNKEVALLHAREYKKMEEARVQKVRLLRDYRAQHLALSQNPDLLKAAPQTAREKLVQTAGAFNQAVEHNVKELKAAVTATQSLLQTVMTAARKENKKTDCYGDHRRDPFMLGAYSPVCDPVAVSRVV